MDITVILNKGMEIASPLIHKIKFKNSIDSLLSSGYIIVNDSGNNFINSGNLVIGTQVDILFREEAGDAIFKTISFKVSGVRRAGPSDETSDYNLGGFIQIFFISSLYFISKENKCHRGSATELVRKLASYDGTIGLDEIEDSDDKNSDTKRYQLKSNYYKFLLNDVLPFATIKQDPSYCYLDINNRLNFISQKTLFSKPVKKTIISAGSNLDAGGALHFESGEWYIGHGLNSLFASLNSVNLIVDSETRQVEGNTDNVSKIQASDYFFVDKSLMSNIGTTYFGHLDSNFLKKDLIAYNKNAKKERNNFFEISLIGVADFEIEAGNVISLVIENTSNKELAIGHVLSGRYVVKSIEYEVSTQGITLMEIQLVRPSIDEATVKSLGLSVDNLYKGVN